jgi:hypothetical protein
MMMMMIKRIDLNRKKKKNYFFYLLIQKRQRLFKRGKTKQPWNRDVHGGAATAAIPLSRRYRRGGGDAVAVVFFK